MALTRQILGLTLTAWVLWSNVKAPERPEVWVRISATETKRECDEEQGRSVQMLHRQNIKPGPQNPGGTIEKTPLGIVQRTPTGVMHTWWWYQCWPDTVDPSRQWTLP